ncbi:lipid-A-disaccharide synthase [uncultured Prevotella sp.]|uniref:lipid-A-disaccharide synthase n=1 Tax=uncultured Prevotella sp. TaxID=159272 RepID=UPI002586717C|nr:lipid-A-disaccharide synthase [uncultured Prevotella sp.]
MKYYLIAGEASGDLHASRLMRAIKEKDSLAVFRFFGGDLMADVGGARVKHYKELAYMGFIPVLLHLKTIFRNMALCKRDIVEFDPDVLILIDYPGFNLSIAKYIHAKTSIPVYYYISPKIWAWKEYRIKNIRRDVDEMFSILPFEVDFYERKHNYPIHYVGNPTADEVAEFKEEYKEPFADFAIRNELDGSKPVIALLAGSRKQEIKDNLPYMIRAAKRVAGDRYQIVIAGAPSISPEYYDAFMKGDDSVKIVFGQTYQLLSHSRVAAVTSGTATLETALFDVPQVVCYKTPIPKVIAFLRKHLLKVKYISLVNLIANEPVVKELVADSFSEENIASELQQLIADGEQRQAMLKGYAGIRESLGEKKAAENAANIIWDLGMRD